MMTIREYARPATLEEAWQLNQKKPNRVLGGMLWLKMEKINVGTAIDLSALGLDTIEETDTEIIIGAMATLRDLETNAALNAYTAGAVRAAAQVRIGKSVWVARTDWYCTFSPGVLRRQMWVRISRS